MPILITQFLRVLAIFLSISVLSGIHWLNRKFEYPTLDQFIFNIEYGSESLSGFDPDVIYSFLRNVFLIALIGAVLWWGVIEKRCPRLPRYSRNGIVFFALFLSVFWVFFQYPLVDYWFNGQQNDTYLESHYHQPDVHPPHFNGRNLILIYLESMEAGYQDLGLFGKNLLPKLSAYPNLVSIPYEQTPGMKWTTAGLVASQCGLPLKTLFVDDHNGQSERLHHFLPRAECLGDTLKKMGYRNVFLFGGEESFGGKATFLEQHGFEVQAKQHWSQLTYPPSAWNAWGLNDDRLFEQAFKQVETLEASSQPYMLGLLTVNTHPPSGYSLEACPDLKDTRAQFSELISCTDQIVDDFVSHLEKAGYLEHTDIVIIGDHLSTANPLSPILDGQAHQTIFSQWISKQTIQVVRPSFMQLDVAASVLDMLGYHGHQGRYGLGYSVFTQPNVPDHRTEDLAMHIPRYSEFYNALWLP